MRKTTPMERVLTTLGHKEPDRVPVFLLLTMHGAKLLDLSPRSYFGRAESMVKAQIKMREMLGHDCYYGFTFAAAEARAFGAEIIYFPDGPPNASKPPVSRPEDIDSIDAPDIAAMAELQEALKLIRGLKAAAGSDVPVIGVVMSPFSLPVMQMGFEGYLDLLMTDRDRFWRLMDVNRRFCADWGNQQLEAGATAIAYFDPVSSSTVITREQYLETGQKVAKRTLPMIKGPTVTHLASGRCLGRVQDIADTGTSGLAVSAMDDLGEVKHEAAGRLSVVGNLNGIEMIRWTRKVAEDRVREAVAKAAEGGGFVLSDNHGELPSQVPWDVLRWIMDAAQRYGRYEGRADR